jgi:hypothetical protein
MSPTFVVVVADALLADLQTTLHANGANLNDGEETWANESQQHVTSQSYQYQHGDVDHQVTNRNFCQVAF